MVASKKIQCAKCSKKCSGNVLKYQDNYYHSDCLNMDDKIKKHSSDINLSTEYSKTMRESKKISGSSTLNGYHNVVGSSNCAGCLQQIKDGEALIALDAQWHILCFKCTKCGQPIHNEFVAKDGKPYCESDYQELFGLICGYCKRYICGKVLQAGTSQYFHPTCARCFKCGDTFLPGEEMYLQGEVIWHARCGPGPESNVEDVLLQTSQQYRNNRAHSPSLSSGRSRSTSPFSFMSRQYERPSPGYADNEPMGDLSRFYTCSYLTSEPTQSYLRRPLEPYPPKSPQFSRPASSAKSLEDRSRSSSRSGVRYGIRGRSLPRAGMQAMLYNLRASTPRPKSPSMMNEEPIELSHYPSAQRPRPDEIPKIERDDFPAPPFPYAEDRLKKVKESLVESDRNRDLNGEPDDENGDPQLRKEEEELSKIASGIGKVFLKTIKEREKIRKWKKANVDPRNASRTPSATRELPSRLRYTNPTNASPSRDIDRAKPWEESEHEYDYASERAARSVTRYATKPNSQLSSPDTYKIVSSLRSTPRPGYGVRSDLGYYEKNRSNQALFRDTPTSEFYDGPGALYNSYMRRSMPNVNNMNYHHIIQEGPLKIYPYHVLLTCNFRLPPDVDRCHLERHLSDEEFQYLFRCERLEFYRMPEWKRNDLKRRIKLF